MAHARDNLSVLFIHQAPTRNGAPMALLHLLRWFREHVKWPFSLLLAQGGDIVDQFENVAPTMVADKSRWCPGGTRSRATTACGLGSFARLAEKSDLRHILKYGGPSVVYMNGFANSNFRLVEVLDIHAPLIAHVHEMGLLFQAQAGSSLPRMLSRTDRFVACSGAVKRNLLLQEGVNSDSIDIVHESIPAAQIVARRPREAILNELGFPVDSQLVVGCGNAAWNKGSDIFVLLTKYVADRCALARFVWVGERPQMEGLRLDQDVRMMGLSDKVRFTGRVADPADYISAADVFVLPSREDSFPLVCLEAAALGKPIVCFADAGGIPEFVEDDAGFVVPYLDIDAMAHRLIMLLGSFQCRQKLGTDAKRKVAERHDVGKAGPQIAEIIERTMTGG